ncbi:MAG TPA: hypothetical protein VGM98_00825 [Schlesneria sp.]|jgi:hypothetical protein
MLRAVKPFRNRSSSSSASLKTSSASKDSGNRIDLFCEFQSRIALRSAFHIKVKSVFALGEIREHRATTVRFHGEIVLVECEDSFNGLLVLTLRERPGKFAFFSQV